MLIQCLVVSVHFLGAENNRSKVQRRRNDAGLALMRWRVWRVSFGVSSPGLPDKLQEGESLGRNWGRARSAFGCRDRLNEPVAFEIKVIKSKKTIITIIRTIVVVVAGSKWQ